MAIFIDEMQYVEEEQLAALITAMHRMSQRRLPVVLVGAGLPQLRGRMGHAKSYAERLFDFPEIGPLPSDAARTAIANPADAEGILIDSDALDRIVEATQGYPYFHRNGASMLGMRQMPRLLRLVMLSRAPLPRLLR